MHITRTCLVRRPQREVPFQSAHIWILCPSGHGLQKPQAHLSVLLLLQALSRWHRTGLLVRLPGVVLEKWRCGGHFFDSFESCIMFMGPFSLILFASEVSNRLHDFT